MEEIMNISGIRCYEKGGTAYLSLDAVARGLGFTQEKSGGKYVRWDRVEAYLAEMGFPHKWGKDDYIPENIFYRLAMKAKNPVAEAFQSKVADEVIPSIRKHGAYMTPETVDHMIASPEFGIKLLTALKEEQDKRKELEQKAAENAPKVLFADAVSAAHTSILVGELAKLLKQNGVEMGQNRLFRWLRSNGYLIQRQGQDFNMPTQKSMELGLFEIKETAITHADGHTTVSKTPKITGKGQQYFVRKFLGNRTESSRSSS